MEVDDRGAKAKGAMGKEAAKPSHALLRRVHPARASCLCLAPLQARVPRPNPAFTEDTKVLILPINYTIWGWWGDGARDNRG